MILKTTPAYLSAALPSLGGEAIKVLQVPGYTAASLLLSASVLPVMAQPSCSMTDSSVVKPAVQRKPRRSTRGSEAVNLPRFAGSSGFTSMVYDTVSLVVGCVFRFYTGMRVLLCRAGAAHWFWGPCSHSFTEVQLNYI